MAKIVSIISNEGPVLTFDVASGTTASITPGMPVKVSGNNVVALATGEPEIAIDQMIGIAQSTSTETASAAGTVQVQTVVPGLTVLKAEAHTAANLSTSRKNNSVTFDLTSGSYTVNEDEVSDPDVHGLFILDQDQTEGTVTFMLKSGASISSQIA